MLMQMGLRSNTFVKTIKLRYEKDTPAISFLILHYNYGCH